MSYNSQYSGAEIDASVAQAAANAEALVALQASIDGYLVGLESLAQNISDLEAQHWYDLGGVLQATAVINFDEIFTGATTGMTVEVPGAAVGDPVIIGYPSGFIYRSWVRARVSIADTVVIEITNEAGGTVTIGTVTFKVAVFKF